MTRKRGLEYENQKPGIGHNTILKDEKKFGWKKNNCARRHCNDWLDDRKAYPETQRPSSNKQDEGWERKVFDFFEPFFLSGCIEGLRGGGKQTTLGKAGSQIDIVFSMEALSKKLNKLEKYFIYGEAKNYENIQSAYEKAINQLHSREFELKQSLGSEINYLPIVFLKGDRKPLDITDPQLQEIHRRTITVWENDIDFYINQAILFGWKRTWKLFLYEVLYIRFGSETKIKLPAIKYQLKGKTAYSTFVPAKIALEICHVERARKNAPHGVYQRPLDISRIKEIADDLKLPNSLNTCFPNSIVASFDNNALSVFESSIWEESQDNFDSPTRQGFLNIHSIYGLIKIIDGQHRVFAHDHLSPDILDNYGMPFTIMEGLKSQDEMILFKSINTTSEDVNPNLVDIILYTMKDIETDRGLASSIICSLEFEDADWTDFFENLGTGIKDYDNSKRGTKIKIDNLVQPIIRGKEEYDLIRDNSKGLLNPSSIDDKLEYGKTIFKGYFLSLKNVSSNKDFWHDYIRTRAGLRLMLMFLSKWIRTKNLRGNPEDKLQLEKLSQLIYTNRNIIKKYFNDSKGRSKGDEYLKDIVEDIL